MPNRRRFLQAAALAAAAGLGGHSSWRAWAEGQAESTAAGLVTGKNPSLIVLGKSPIVLETPLSQLDSSTLTSVADLFVRNNSNPDGMATTLAPALSGWNVELTGLEQGAATISFDQLRTLPQTSVEMVLQCSGNGRNMFSRAAKISGTPWGRGGIGNVRFGGVKLRDVLALIGQQPADGARYLTAEGIDVPKPGDADFEHSVPLGDALQSALLALTLNGEPLPAVHGGPVRLVLPGYYGTVQVKWLSRLRFEADESPNEHHAVRYRTPDRLLQPGEKFAFDRSNSVPTWKQKVAILVTSHLDGERVSAGSVRLSGYAWNDGAVPVTHVLASRDIGQTWSRLSLEQAESPYAWSRWTCDTTLTPGQQSFWFAAIDALGRSQPLDGQVNWNPGGYEWNGVERLTINVV